MLVDVDDEVNIRDGEEDEGDSLENQSNKEDLCKAGTSLVEESEIGIWSIERTREPSFALSASPAADMPPPAA